ncbi:hypothetical protein [Bosea sp. NBC_00550]|uniref:hypothetical protein n=1 Tax=Bosea sp. NBC_00550 TaxID=2969621 RepID=UPI0022320E26|nr:hypothetical protein [Bosea sp. NBC_00550]UZF95787.1 hypothetical protein NWE53_27780 [Bosea sp. NBC_00550]
MRKLFLKNIDEYRDAARRLDAIGKIEPGSPAPPEYELLMAAVDCWEETHDDGEAVSLDELDSDTGVKKPNERGPRG